MSDSLKPHFVLGKGPWKFYIISRVMCVHAPGYMARGQRRTLGTLFPTLGIAFSRQCLLLNPESAVWGQQLQVFSHACLFRWVPGMQTQVLMLVGAGTALTW